MSFLCLTLAETKNVILPESSVYSIKPRIEKFKKCEKSTPAVFEAKVLNKKNVFCFTTSVNA